MQISEVQSPELSRKTLNEIDLFLEDFYPKSRDAGIQLAECGMKNNQVRGLENIIVSTTRFSEILNYVKNQAGKEKNDNQWRTVAPTILAQFDELEEKAFQMADENASERLQIKLQLVKGWARQMVAHYLYEKLSKGERP